MRKITLATIIAIVASASATAIGQQRAMAHNGTATTQSTDGSSSARNISVSGTRTSNPPARDSFTGQITIDGETFSVSDTSNASGDHASFNGDNQGVRGGLAWYFTWSLTIYDNGIFAGTISGSRRTETGEIEVIDYEFTSGSIHQNG